MEEILLIAEEGKVYTNGTIYGKTISLPKGSKTEEFTQISEEEYKAMQKNEIELL